MRIILKLFRVSAMMFGLGLLALAAIGAAKEREDRQNLPTRIGEVIEERTFWEETQEHAAGLWMDIFIALGVGVPGPAEYERLEPNSLDALQTRTKNLSRGLNADGSSKLNF